MRFILAIVALVFPLHAGAAGFLHSPSSSGNFTTVPAQTSALATLAESMNPGDWAQLTTINLPETLGYATGSYATGHDLSYADYLKWDSAGKKLMYLGADHYHNPSPWVIHFSVYDEPTNTWSRYAQQDWMTNFGSRSHGYDQGAFDPSRRQFYAGLYASTKIYRYDMATDSWSELPIIPPVSYNGWEEVFAMDWFPERDSLLVFNREKVFEYSPTTNSWSTLATLPTIQGYNVKMEYSPVYGEMFLGSGTLGPLVLYKLNSAGVATRMADAPADFSIKDDSNNLTADPVTGDLILRTRGNVLYQYDVSADSWSMLDDGTGLPPRTGYTTAGAIDTYGVIIYVTMTTRTAGYVWLYKHAE